MTTTSVLTATPPTIFWKARLRLVSLAVLIVVLCALAFTVGRATMHVRDAAPAIAPSSISSSSNPATADGCRMQRPVC